MFKSFVQLHTFFSVAFIAVCFLVPATVSAGVVTKPINSLGLIGYWNFEEDGQSGTVVDRSGTDNDGTVSGFTESANIVDGYNGRAVSLTFDGDNDYVSIDDDASLNDNTNFSTSMWVYMDRATDPSGLVLIGKDDTFWIQVGADNGSDQQLHMQYGSAGAAMGSDGDIQQDVWYHIALTFDGTNLEGYLDGELLSGATTGSAPSGMDGSLFLAAYGGNGATTPDANWYHDGRLDEVRMYDRTLSADEVSNIYQNKAILKSLDTTNLIGYWSFEDATGTLATDFSINNNEATFTNNPTWIDGRVGKAIELDGSSQEITAPLDINNRTELTMSIWVYPHSSNGSDFQHAIGNDNGGHDRSISNKSNVWRVLMELII